jgi:very-short-patch-repair endonuclease
MASEQNFNKTDFHLPYNPKLVPRAKELRQNMTQAEKKLWYSYLKTFNFWFLRQRPIGNFIVDFYCAELKLVIEVDRNSNFTEEGQNYDMERTQVLEGYGLKVMRFNNSEVLSNLEGVCGQIEGLIPPTPLNKGGLKV